MEYCIAGDDGSAGIWNRPFDVDLDGDGRLDAIGLDLDGDGLRDDALADFDGDDVADHAVFDVDNDGTPESYFIDDGSGTWAVAVDRGGWMERPSISRFNWPSWTLRSGRCWAGGAGRRAVRMARRGSYGIAGPVRCSWDCRCWRRR